MIHYLEIDMKEARVVMTPLNRPTRPVWSDEGHPEAVHRVRLATFLNDHRGQTLFEWW